MSLYLAPLSGGVECRPETGLGRIAAHVEDDRLTGSWHVSADVEHPIVVDGLGYAREPDGPLVAVHYPPPGESALPPGEALLWSVCLEHFTPCG